MEQRIFTILSHLGGLGLLGFGILDSSFMVLPFGNDLLMVGLSARRHEYMPYYAAMATAGSVLGCLILDLVCRKGGKEGLAKRLSRRRLEYITCQVEKRAGWALAFAALMPPPFPFTPFVMAASALRYPRRKLLGVVAATRLFRFCAEGILAIAIGRRILRVARSQTFRYIIIIMIVISVAASAFSIYIWSRQSARAAAGK